MSWFCSKCGDELRREIRPKVAEVCVACKRVALAEVQWATKGIAVGSLSYIFVEIVAELGRARAKFPSNAHLNVALTEEVGEVAKEFLDGGTKQRIREEAVQVAVVAIRLALEGDSDFGRNFLEDEPRGEFSFTVDGRTFSYESAEEAQKKLSLIQANFPFNADCLVFDLELDELDQVLGEIDDLTRVIEEARERVRPLVEREWSDELGGFHLVEAHPESDFAQGRVSFDGEADPVPYEQWARADLALERLASMAARHDPDLAAELKSRALRESEHDWLGGDAAFDKAIDEG